MLKHKIKVELLETKDINIGRGFLMFTNDQVVKELRYFGLKHLQSRIDKLPQETVNLLQLNKWKFKRAPAQSDMIWSYLNLNRTLSTIKTILLMLVLVIAVGATMTP